MLNSFQRLGNIEDRLEAQISAIKNIQEEFRHDIREMKEQLARLTNLFKDHIETQTVYSRGQSPLPNQQVPRPFIQTIRHLPRGTYRPSLRQPMPTAPLAFMKTYGPIDQPSGSRGKPSE